jgi:hypothetical protein
LKKILNENNNSNSSNNNNSSEFLNKNNSISNRLKGVKTLFSGVGPRVTWISIGGFVFFGVYEKCVLLFGF